MKKAFCIATLGAFVLAFVQFSAKAHIRVSPADSKAGSAETYMVSIPTEGKVPTIRTELVLPVGVELVSVDPEGKPFEIEHPTDGSTIIIWHTEIPPGWAKQFHFTVSNPSTAPEINWKAHQYFSDGTVADWVDTPGSKRPASATTLHP